MTRNKKIILYVVLAAAVVMAFIAVKGRRGTVREITREVSPIVGTIRSTINATGTVQPQNRLEVKPPINGRVEEILVREGDLVKAGQLVAWMSSTERAALLDAARAQGADGVKRWEDVYKATPLISPIDGEVIVSKTEPGQTVTSSDAVVVLSNHLIVQAQVDETDIGKAAVGQAADVSLDAYPEIRVKGKVDHIYYESKVVNNVTIYQVDILPETVPRVFRSGMSATVTITANAKEKALLVPLEAVRRNKDGAYLLVSRGIGRKPEERGITLGITDEKEAEVVSGIDEKDRIVVVNQKYAPAAAQQQGRNPFMPAPRRGQTR